ncbi:Stp1/IreP family PP2C-type Ser/Thr phosphatase [Filibacter tadaridae]|uniref:Serine/threonine phosphatase stp n=1 Tax=Filibacter tadaridae TaxID=2483811 RepID=A0A3P5X4H2_9BACL|nr:Stp1/IreP family PP2C-type Ser/Thr phosphatase [Filibacter tadaridae]VDC29804.1 Serine/threonine phosphatase stp [Filibacter tadaridae]
MQFEVLTDIGKKRTVNEDSAAVYTLPDGTTLAVIADGMGGHNGGDFASSTAVKVLGERFMEIDQSQLVRSEDCAKWLKESIVHVNKLLYDLATENEEYKGMGTTLDAALIQGTSCMISHIGDSRVYTICEDGMKQVTKDHSFVNVLLESGEITEEEAAVHPKRNWIMKAVGSEKLIEPDFYSISFKEGMILLICTDGLSNKVDNPLIEDIVKSTATLSEKAKSLVDLANGLGGEDNISVILIEPAGSEVNLP